MKKFSLILLFLIPAVLYGQEYAEFSIDTTRFRHFYNSGKLILPEYISEQQWFINGQKMDFKSKRIKVKVTPNSLDTILYKGFRRNEFDTIICNISEAKEYSFFYNECCGAFNVMDNSTGKFISGKVIYQLSSEDSTKTYIGTLGEVGTIVNNSTTDTLTEDCRSAMSPNIYNISFKEILNCVDSLNCNEGICLHVSNRDEPIWNYSFETISTKLDLLYLPLSDKPLIISYNPERDEIRVENGW